MSSGRVTVRYCPLSSHAEEIRKLKELEKTLLQRADEAHELEMRFIEAKRVLERVSQEKEAFFEAVEQLNNERRTLATTVLQGRKAEFGEDQDKNKPRFFSSWFSKS